jgi:hypothetical protein
MYAGGTIKMKSKGSILMNSDASIGINGEKNLLLYSKQSISVRSDGNLAMKGAKSSWNGGSSLNFKASKINLNGAPTLPTGTVPALTGYKLAGTTFVNGQGWIVQPGEVETIVTRAPTHEPYPYHNTGVNNTADLNDTLTVPQDSNNPITGIDSAKVEQAYQSVVNTTVENPLKIENFVKELPSSIAIGTVDEQAFRDAVARPINSVTQTAEQAAVAVARGIQP